MCENLTAFLPLGSSDEEASYPKLPIVAGFQRRGHYRLSVENNKQSSLSPSLLVKGKTTSRPVVVPLIPLIPLYVVEGACGAWCITMAPNALGTHTDEETGSHQTVHSLYKQRNLI